MEQVEDIHGRNQWHERRVPVKSRAECLFKNQDCEKKSLLFLRRASCVGWFGDRLGSGVAASLLFLLNSVSNRLIRKDDTRSSIVCSIFESILVCDISFIFISSYVSQSDTLRGHSPDCSLFHT